MEAKPKMLSDLQMIGVLLYFGLWPLAYLAFPLWKYPSSPVYGLALLFPVIVLLGILLAFLQGSQWAYALMIRLGYLMLLIIAGLFGLLIFILIFARGAGLVLWPALMAVAFINLKVLQALKGNQARPIRRFTIYALLMAAFVAGGFGYYQQKKGVLAEMTQHIRRGMTQAKAEIKSQFPVQVSHDFTLSYSPFFFQPLKDCGEPAISGSQTRPQAAGDHICRSD